MVNILSVYDGFFVGGSRIVHTSIIAELQKQHENDHSVISLSNRVTREFSTQYAEQTPSWKVLEDVGIPVEAINRDMKDGFSADDIEHLEQKIREADIVLTLKEQPLVGLSHVKNFDKPLIVSLHRSDPENQGEGTKDLLDVYHNGLLTKVICCAQAAKNAYVKIGIADSMIEVVDNGIDLDRFYESASVRESFRNDLNIPLDAPVVSIAARYDGMKNIPLFVESAGLYLARNKDAHVIACGTGITRLNDVFDALVHKFLSDDQLSRFHALGVMSNVSAVYNATDLVVLTSAFGEAAPLCLLEGMACGAIPVTTDVGDSARMVKDDRLVVPADASSQVIVEAWENAYALRDEHRAIIAGKRASLDEKHMVAHYNKILSTIE